MSKMHKFKIGENVRFSGARMYERGVTTSYTVTAQLPEERGDWQYRIQTTDRTRERVVKESQLSSGSQPLPVGAR
jgi:hypothetical protein